MSKKGYSRKGFFGETNHYDANGKKTGETRKNFWGGYDHYDAKGHKIGTSREGIFGGMNHYDNRGKKTGHSHQGFWGQTNHYSSGVSYDRSRFDYDHDSVQDEVDCFDDPNEATTWLEDEGYDPDDFDL